MRKSDKKRKTRTKHKNSNEVKPSKGEDVTDQKSERSTAKNVMFPHMSTKFKTLTRPTTRHQNDSDFLNEYYPVIIVNISSLVFDN